MSDVKKLINKHKQLNLLDMAKVVGHVQREADDRVLNTIMLGGYAYHSNTSKNILQQP